MTLRVEMSDEEQRAMDDMLQVVFTDETVPRLSLEFNARLRARVRQAPDSVQQVDPTPLLSRNGKLLMRIYWTVACFSSSFIVFHTEWPTLRSPFLLIAAILVSVISLSPFVLMRHVRSRLPDVLLTAIE